MFQFSTMLIFKVETSQMFILFIVQLKLFNEWKLKCSKYTLLVFLNRIHNASNLEMCNSNFYELQISTVMTVSM